MGFGDLEVDIHPRIHLLCRLESINVFRMNSQTPLERTRKPWLAGLLSLILPGAGQIYNGHLTKGLLFALLVSLYGYHKFSPIVLWGFDWLVSVVLLQFAIYLAIFFHAIRDARRNSIGPAKSWYAYLGLVGLYLLAALPGIFIDPAYMTTRIPAASMVPAVVDGDFIVSDLREFRHSTPKPGSLAIFAYPADTSIMYIKRVMAVPGDVVKYKNMVLSINGKTVKNEPIKDSTLKDLISDAEDRKVLEPFMEEYSGAQYPVLYNSSTLLNWDYGPVTVPEKKYFTLGDNRDRSADSRAWGFVPVENFIAKPAYVYFSWNPNSRAIRWERIGLRLK